MKYRIGIDLGGTNIKAGVVDEDNRIVAYDTRPTDADRPFAEVVLSMAQSAKDAAAQLDLTLADFPCLGVGTPGSVQRKFGKVLRAGNLNWYDVPLRDELQKHVSTPVYVGNDADCAAAGESIAGAAKDYNNVLLFTLGTGVGGGIIIEKKIFSGGDGLGAELGHIPLVFEGVHCTCGIDGCFEAYASVTGLIRQTREAMAAHPDSLLNNLAEERGVVNGRTPFDAAKAGDAAALAVIDRYISYVAAGIGGCISIFRPEIVLLGGGVSQEGAYLMDPLNERLPKYVFGSAYNGVPMAIQATLGNDAGVIGAAYLDIV
ncbi:MAG: ROK family protein [Clostridia bacterium]|nr:ROK family protein [Clostridia bacterium]